LSDDVSNGLVGHREVLSKRHLTETECKGEKCEEERRHSGASFFQFPFGWKHSAYWQTPQAVLDARLQQAWLGYRCQVQ
jgi:hypothetical protein